LQNAGRKGRAMPGEKDIAPPLSDGCCVECGAEVAPLYASCDEMFMSILTNRIPYDACGYRVRRMVVDGYAMQHQKRSGKSAKSYAAHLTGLCCGVEYNGSESVYAAIQQWLNGKVEDIGISRPSDIESTGSTTIRYVNDAPTNQEVAERVSEWVGDVWRAYESQHAIAREWIKEALSRGRRT